MQIIHWGILLVLVLAVPLILGMIPIKHMNKLQRTPAMAYICGWFISFAVFEVVAVPFILLEQSFTLVVVVYTFLICVLLGISLWRGRNVLGEFAGQIKGIKNWTLSCKIGWIVVFLLIAVQMFVAVFWEYYDGDDAYYIATAVVTDTFDTMYLRDNYTGYLYPLDGRHALSPTPVYQAWLSRLSGIHPAVIAHSVLSAVWLLLMYCVYGQIARRLFPKKEEYRPLFMIFMTIWYAFRNISLYTAETFAMTRTWQGKGLMAGIVLPALFLCFLYLADEHPQRGIWMLFCAVIISAVFATSVAFMLIPTLVGVAALLLAWRKHSIRILLQMGACCIPCFIFAVCYLMAK